MYAHDGGSDQLLTIFQYNSGGGGGGRFCCCRLGRTTIAIAMRKRHRPRISHAKIRPLQKTSSARNVARKGAEDAKEEAPIRRLGSAVFLDLDETLLYSTFVGAVAGKERYNAARGAADYEFDGIVGYHRPHAHDLLRFLHARFDHLFIFTAGTRQYADGMVRLLFASLPFQPTRVFDRSHAVQESENTAFLEYWQKYTKMLVRLDDLPADVDLDDSILIDDVANNARNNLPQAILVPKYQYSASFEGDDWLLRLERYLAAKPASKTWSEIDKSAWFLDNNVVDADPPTTTLEEIVVDDNADDENQVEE